MRLAALVLSTIIASGYPVALSLAASEEDEQTIRRVSPAQIQRVSPSTQPQRANPEPQRADPAPQRATPAPQRATTTQPQRVTPAAGRAVLASPQPELSLQVIKDVPYEMPSRAKLGISRAPQTAMQKMEPTYSFPFHGDDLAAGERIYRGKKIHSDSGSQKWGYDLGAMRHGSNDKWADVKSSTDWKNPKNTDFYVYGQPVYAMGPGTIIRCWRNAPENPRPYSSALGDSFDEDFEDRDWLHTAWRAKKMSGGGNHLLVEEDDGDLVLYAHAQPGTISTALCPHNATLYSSPGNDSEGDVPEAQRVRIKAGDYLYKAGNSGNSSGPHLHVHLQDPDGNPKQLRFNRGLAKPLVDKKASLNGWTRFAPNRIPDGPTLVWPARKLVGEYARHGFPSGSFQRMFDHLSDSGFWPVWIDGYSVGGKGYLNFVWRPAKGAWRAFFLVTPAKYQAEIDKAKNDGFAPVFLDGSLVGGQPRYTIIFVKNKPGGWLARHGLNYNQHMAVMDEAKSKGLYPVDISVMSVGGQRRYTVLYRAENLGSWVVKSQVPEAEYQTLYNQQSNEGRKPSYANAYMHQGKPYYTVVFSQMPNGPRKDRHALTANAYQSNYTSALQNGLLTRIVSGYDGAQKNHRFIATWRK